MEIQAFGRTDVGRQRGHNEDSMFSDPQLGLYIVCDGMGGHAAGEVASALAIRTICEHMHRYAPQITGFDGSQSAIEAPDLGLEHSH